MVFINLLVLAVLSGVLTIIAPCILSLLPIMLGSSLGGGSRWRPLLVVLGMIASFTGFGFIFAAFTSFLGLPRETVRSLAVVLILVFGLALLFSTTYDKLMAELQSLWTRIKRQLRLGRTSVPPPQRREGLGGAFMLGASMGIAWVPCAGPVLGIILTIATVQGNLFGGTILFLAYALGAGVPMLVIGYGGKWIVGRVRWLATRAETIRRVAGALLVIMGVAMLLGVDRKLETAIFSLFPNTSAIEEQVLEATFDPEQMPDTDMPPTDMPLLRP